MITSPYSKLLYVIEADHRTSSPQAQKQKLAEFIEAGEEVDQSVVELPFETFGLPRVAAGSWGSCVRIIDPVEVSAFLLNAIHLLLY